MFLLWKVFVLFELYELSSAALDDTSVFSEVFDVFSIPTLDDGFFEVQIELSPPPPDVKCAFGEVQDDSSVPTLDVTSVFNMSFLSDRGNTTAVFTDPVVRFRFLNFSVDLNSVSVSLRLLSDVRLTGLDKSSFSRFASPSLSVVSAFRLVSEVLPSILFFVFNVG